MEIHYYDSLPSTNTVLLQMSKKGAKAWTVVWTTDQTEGRGYAGNKWKAEKGKNIAVSILITNDLDYEELIFFNQWVCNCLCELLGNYVDDVYVKWPNDLIISNKKVCGVLIETHRSGNHMNIVTGIGLNINQTEFQGLPKAGSLATSSARIYEIAEILSGILTKLKDNYVQIQNKEWDFIRKTYNSKLFLKNKTCSFRIETNEFQGIIRLVDASGLLHVELKNGSIKSFNNKEIELIF